MVIKIPLDSGLVTQVDPDEVGANACTELTNVEFDKTGLLYKRNGFDAGIDIHPSDLNELEPVGSMLVFTNNDVNLVAIKRFYNPNLTSKYTWVATYANNSRPITNRKYIALYYSNDGLTWTLINEKIAHPFLSDYWFTDIFISSEDFSNDKFRADIKDFNSQIRFVLGKTNDTRLWQYIKRDFFWNTQSTDSWEIDIARPRNVLTGVTSVVSRQDPESSSNWFYNQTDGHDLSATTYFYKYSLVFDGYQESNTFDSIGETSAFTQAKSVVQLELSFNVGTGSPYLNNATLNGWNDRVTGINIYRATSLDGIYSKVYSVGLLSDDGSVQTVSDTMRRSLYDPNGGLNTADGVTGLTATAGDYVSKTLTTFAEGSTSPDFLDRKSIKTVYEDILEGDSNINHMPSLWKEAYWIFRNITEVAHESFTFTGTVSGFTEHNYSSGPWVEALTHSGDYLQYKKTNSSPDQPNYGDLAVRKTGITSLTAHSIYKLNFDFITSNENSSDNGKIRISTTKDNGSNYTEIANIDHDVAGTTSFSNLSFYFKTDGDVSQMGIEIRFDFDSLVNPTKYALIRVDNLTITRIMTVVSERTNGYAGQNVFVSNNLELGALDSHKGYVYQLGRGGLDVDESGYIEQSTTKAVKVVTKNQFNTFIDENGQVSTTGNETNLRLSPSHLIEAVPDSSSGKLQQKITVFDKEFVNGVENPIDNTSLDVKYKYSKYMNGRNFVANVKITNDNESEEHENWIMFSELNQPDVIPITNYIQLKDAQGGAIVGVESLLGDLVVFMEKGVYRLSIPSADPTAWSLSEAEENIGCISTESITKWEAGIFFAGKDHLYFLDANFQAQPMTRAIKDLYQGFADASVVAYDGIKTFYDPKKNKLFMYNAGVNKKAYVLDLSVYPKERWVYHYPNPDPTTAKTRFMTIDENLKVYHIEDFSAQDKRRMRTEDGTSTEATLFKRQTGWISGPDLGKRIHVRRLNLKYNSGSDITVRFYVDGDESTSVRTLTIPADTSGQDWYRCAPGVRGRQFMMEMETESSINDVEISRLEVEFE